MHWRHWVMITSLVGLIVSLTITSGLHTSAYEKQSEQIHDALDEAEKEMGTYTPEARKEAMPARAMRLAREQKALVEEKQREFEELILQEQQALGLAPVTDTTVTSDEIRYDEYGRPISTSTPQQYFDEYGRPIH